MKYNIPFIIFLAGAIINLNYAFTTNYITVYDAARGYELYIHYLDNPCWDVIQNSLQNTALLTTYLPARLNCLLGFSPEIFFKWYISIMSAFVPVIAYYIARKINVKYAVFAAIFVMGWVAFYQGGSFARSNFAMIVYGLLILTMLSSWRYRYYISIMLVILLPLTHYGAAFVAVPVLGGLLAWYIIRRNRKEALYIGIILMALVTCTVIWHGLINFTAWKYMGYIIEDTASTGVLSPIAPLTADKITQAATGVINPDGDTNFTLNWWMFGFAWVTVMMMVYGAYYMIRGKSPAIYKILVVLSFMAIGLTVAVPQISRGYGVEKVYYQAIMVLAPCCVNGGLVLAEKIKIPAWIVLSGVIMPYVVLMQIYGVIPSALG